jgi:Bacterial type II secretion system protein G.
VNTGKKLLWYLLLVVALFVTASCSQKPPEKGAELLPTTQHAVVNPNETELVRLRDLSSIAFALEKYKRKYNQYPMSSNRGRNWDGLYSNFGESKKNWIEGLVPDFMANLPRDPRMSDSGLHQYLYKSNGANYKLISHSPDDCGDVLKIFPKLIDPKRNCWAYGYWTPRAVNW